MMNRFVALLFIVFLCISIQAQDFRTGIGAGVNLYKFNVGNSTFGKYDYQMGAELKAIFEKDIDERFKLRLEPGLASKGSKWSFENSETAYNLLYLDVPVLIALYPMKNLALLAGPNVSFLLHSRNKDAAGNTSNGKNLFDKKIDLGLNLGIQYTLNPNFDFGIRFNKGLLKLFEFVASNEFGEVTETVNPKSEGFSVYLSYFLN